MHHCNILLGPSWVMCSMLSSSVLWCAWRVGFRLQASHLQGGAPGDQLLASSSRSEVLLWRADGFDTGPHFSWPGLTRGRFNPAATQVGAAGSQHDGQWHCPIGCN